MSLENVLNRFEQPVGGSNDNKLVLGGTAESEEGQSLKTVAIGVTLPDVSTASSTVYAFPGVKGRVAAIRGVQNAGVTVADAIVSFKIGGATIGATFTILEDSVAGQTYEDIPIAASIASAQNIQVITDGGSTGVCPLSVYFVFELD